MSDSAGRAHASTTTAGVLAGALLLVELLAGVQTFVVATVTPLLAADLDARHLYGVITAATQVPMFLTLPLGVALLTRFPAATLLLWLTPLVVVGGVVSAVAPGIEVFLLGRVLAALAAGALMSVSLSALVTDLPRRWRRRVLAGYAATWVVAALVGPLYAGWVSVTWGWRWALVGYLPLLLVVRVVIARQLAHAPDPATPRRALPWRESVVLAAGVAGLATAAALTPLAFGAAALGAVAVGWAVVRLLPRGVLTARPGRRGGLAVLGLLSLGYFGGYSVIGVLAHDLLGRGAGDVAALFGLGALTWSIMGLLCGRYPARTPDALVRRARSSAALLGVGALVVALALPLGSWPLLAAGWGVVGLGMGTGYLDSLDLVLTQPERDDGIEPTEAAGAAILVETVATAVVATICTTVLAAAIAGVGSADLRALADPTGAPVLAGVAVFATLALAAVGQVAVAARLRPVG